MDPSSSQGQNSSSGENRPSGGGRRRRSRQRQGQGQRRDQRTTGDGPGTAGGGRTQKSARPPERKPGFFDRLLRFFGFGRKTEPKSPQKTGIDPERRRRDSLTVEVNSVRLFVGNLAYDAAEADLRSLFETVGTVADVEIATDSLTSRSKGFAFVEMDKVEEARRAVEKLNDTEFMGRSLLVTGALSEGRKSGDAEKEPRSSRGRAEGERGEGRREKRQRKDRVGDDRALREDREWSAPKAKVVEAVFGPRLRVDNLDSEVTEELLREAFDGFGAMVALELSGQSARIEMSSTEEAQRALEVLDGKMFMGRRLKISAVAGESPAESGGAEPATDGASPE